MEGSGFDIPLSTRDEPFGLTFALFFLVGISTFLGFALPKGSARNLFLVITAPFNTAGELNPYSNIFLLLLIFATTEIYMKATNRSTELLVAFISSIVATYIVSIYLLVNTGRGVAGTSIIGFSILLFLILVIVIDLLGWAYKTLEKNKKAVNLLKVAIAFILTAFVSKELITFLFYLYVKNNQSVQLHEWGGLVSLSLTFVILLFRAWAFPRSRVQKKKLEIKDLQYDF